MALNIELDEEELDRELKKQEDHKKLLREAAEEEDDNEEPTRDRWPRF